MNSILVLNADNSPLNVTSFRRGFNLVFMGKATVVEYDETPIKTATKNYKRPTIIRLLRWIYIPHKSVPMTRFNIFRRDGHACVYCDVKNVSFTLDHVMPKSRGGKNSWENLVTCCKRCNTVKDNKTPKEAGMPLLRKPYKPTFTQFISAIRHSKI